MLNQATFETTMNPTTTTSFSSYLLPPPVFNSRYHQHLNHLNDMAFTHTKMLQELMEKRSTDSASTLSSPSSSSISPLAATSNDLIQSKKRSHSHLDQNEEDNRQQIQHKPSSVKRSKTDEDDGKSIQQTKSKSSSIEKNQSENNCNDEDDTNLDIESSSEHEIGEVHSQDEQQNTFSIAQPPLTPSAAESLSFLNYVQNLIRTNSLTSPLMMTDLLENLQREYFTSIHNLSTETKHNNPILPLPFPQSVPSQHPFLPQVLFNNSLINHYIPHLRSPLIMPFVNNNTLVNRSFSYQMSTPKRRRTKVTDTRLSPRTTSKVIVHEDIIDDDRSLSNHSCDSIITTSNLHQYHPHSSQHTSVDHNTFQIMLTSLHLRKAKLMFFYTRYPSSSLLKIYFPDVRFNKLITAQLVKWFSNFREFFYIQIEKYARQYLAEGTRNTNDLIITTDSDLYRILNLHYNRSNQIDVPMSFRNVVQSTLREFFHAIQQRKDLEPSWKKSIYKIIQRLDDQIPDFFKDEHWMHSI